MLAAMPDPAAVNSMFARIAGRYDLANRLLSGGTDIWWRRQLVRTVAKHQPQRVLDLATGSGDVAFALSKHLSTNTLITGMDFCQPMLDQAIRKQASAPNAFANISFQAGDALQLPLADASFDVVTIAFGLRNLADRDRGLREMRRILRPEGTLIVLEFSQPFRWFRPIYYFYLQRILPTIAGWVTGDKAAYDYLNRTIGAFPDRHALSAECTNAGFTRVSARPMTLGIVALHEATR
jgi:demethylmenaquinone methyltransferase/2-methoxy-6-polyprenyl-1,4-benzoquinol methylase